MLSRWIAGEGHGLALGLGATQLRLLLRELLAKRANLYRRLAVWFGAAILVHSLR